MSNRGTLKTFGENLRDLRESKGLLLREVAASLGIDTALLSKFERNNRKPSRDQVIVFAKFYGTSQDDLVVAWLSDKIASDIEGEDLALKAMQVAQAKIKFQKRQK